MLNIYISINTLKEIILGLKETGGFDLGIAFLAGLEFLIVCNGASYSSKKFDGMIGFVI